MPADQLPTGAAANKGGRAALTVPAGVLALIAGVLTLLPLGAVFTNARLSADAPSSLDVGLLVSSLSFAFGVSVLATLFALPLAWSLRRVHAVALSMLAVPLVLPSYLVSFCLTLLVQPQSALGAWLAVQGQSHAPWLPALVMKAIACVGLAAWLCPLGALLLSTAIREVSAELLDSLRLDASRGQRVLQLLRVLRAPLLACIAMLGLIMLGSAVPLHLANAPTLAVKAWASAILAPASLDPWLTSAPLLVVACGAGIVLTTALGRSSLRASQRAMSDNAMHASAVTSTRGAFLSSLLAAPILLVALPLVAAFVNIKNFSSIPAFIHVAQGAMMSSSLLAIIVGFGLACILALAMRAGPLHKQPRIAHCALAAMLAFAFVPGILVGQAWSVLAYMLPLPAGSQSAFASTAVLALAHISRFAGIFAALGFLFASLEPTSRMHARALDHALSTKGWFLSTSFGSSRAMPAILLVATAAGACLSLHEIESTIMLQLPGTGSIGQTMLANLHFARSEELCAGILTTTLFSLVPLALAALLIARDAK